MVGGFGTPTGANGSISTAADPGLTVSLVTSEVQHRVQHPAKINPVEPELRVQFNDCGIRPGA